MTAGLRWFSFCLVSAVSSAILQKNAPFFFLYPALLGADSLYLVASTGVTPVAIPDRFSHSDEDGESGHEIVMRKIAGLHCISILPEAIPRTFKMYGTNWMQKSAPDRIPIATPPVAINNICLTMKETSCFLVMPKDWSRP